MTNKLETIVRKAGNEILKYYDQKNMNIEIKKDGSPVTKADFKSEQVIVSELTKYFNYPIITEETPVPYSKRKKWKKFWLVDPLDGTMDFIEKNDEFTINIALIENNLPLVGIVFAPALNIIYTAEKNLGAKKNGKPIKNSSKRKKLIGADSRNFSTSLTKNFIVNNKINKVIKLGSSLKLCALAEGKIDVYPRFNGSKEWDTAAPHIICSESGCKIIDLKSKKEMTYNKKSIKNNFFIASRNDLSFH